MKMKNCMQVIGHDNMGYYIYMVSLLQYSKPIINQIVAIRNFKKW